VIIPTAQGTGSVHISDLLPEAFPWVPSASDVS